MGRLHRSRLGGAVTLSLVSGWMVFASEPGNGLPAVEPLPTTATPVMPIPVVPIPITAAPITAAPIAPPPMVLPDPTKPSDQLNKILNPPAKAGPSVPSAKLPLPVVSICARIVPKGRPAIAILDVDGRKYTVSEGSLITAATGASLRVKELSVTGIRLEMDSGGESLIVH